MGSVIDVTQSWTFLSSPPTVMELDRQPRSGLATVKRDFSSNSTTDTPRVSAPAVGAAKRSTISDSLRKAIQDGVASREAEKSSNGSQKRSLPSEVVPPSKKRQLPSSWVDCEPSSTPYSHSSSAFLRALSFTSSDLPQDMMSQGNQDGPESPLASSSQPKLARRAPEIVLSDEQKHILELVVQKKNLFYTGSAGLSLFSPFLNVVIVGLLRSTSNFLWGVGCR